MPAQHFNHIHFWKWMKKGGGGDKIPGQAGEAAHVRHRADGKSEGRSHSGRRHAVRLGLVLARGKDGKITIMKTPNGENPLVHGGKPILGCDVWEHSYYIDYRNRRPDYLKAFFDNLVNWDYVAEMYEAAMK